MIARRRQAPVRLAALLTLTLAVPAAAQLTDAGTPVRPPGWSVTPAIGVSESWDDNPTLASETDVRTGDFVTSVQPTLALDYRGRHTTLGGDYGGVFDFYRELNGLNTRDHRAAVDFTHQATRRLQLFANDQAALSPTTADALEVSATVLRRQTTRMNAFRGGFEAMLGRQTTLNAAYVSQWIEFANDDTEPINPIPPPDALLLGGHSHAGDGELRHRVNRRFSIGADYLIQRAIVANGSESFDVQSALAVSELALGPSVSASFGYGHAWLTAGDGFRDNGPAFDLQLAWTGRHSGASVSYGRTVLPSFGFGGTFQNEELRGDVRAWLTRSLQWSGSVALSDNDPLEPGDPSLRSLSARTALGWVIKRRLRFDAFVQHVSQDSGLAGGHVVRTRAGVQATVSQTVRATR